MDSMRQGPSLTRSGYSEAYDSESDKFGHRMQELLCQIMTEQLEIPEVGRSVVGQELSHFAFAKATEEEDGNGIDFLFYNPQSKTWIKMDFTVSNNHVDLKAKEEKISAIGGVVLKIPAHTLELAAQGAERDIKAVAREITNTFGIQ